MESRNVAKRHHGDTAKRTLSFPYSSYRVFWLMRSSTIVDVSYYTSVIIWWLFLSIWFGVVVSCNVRRWRSVRWELRIRIAYDIRFVLIEIVNDLPESVSQGKERRCMRDDGLRATELVEESETTFPILCSWSASTTDLSGSAIENDRWSVVVSELDDGYGDFLKKRCSRAYLT